MLKDVLGYICVSMCWGCTNPWIKRGSAGIEYVQQKYKTHSFISRQYRELAFLLTRWQYVVYDFQCSCTDKTTLAESVWIILLLPFIGYIWYVLCIDLLMRIVHYGSSCECINSTDNVDHFIVYG